MADDSNPPGPAPFAPFAPAAVAPAAGAPERHRRRVRYAGTHPKHFAEKYKELDPAQHADELQKVMQRGQTPAGSHRPICVAEIMAVLAPQPGDVGLDATLGFGGHTQQLLARMAQFTPGGRMWAIDVDPLELPRTEARLRGLGFDASVLQLRRLNFAQVASLLPDTAGGFDFVLADLGVSSMQIDNPERGFSFKADGPLDLRLDPSAGLTASELLQQVTRHELRDLLVDNADEPYAVALAAALQGQYILGTAELAERVRQTLQRSLSSKLPQDEREAAIKGALQRTFQALRIAVNQEFAALDSFLAALPACLKPGGRVAVLSFHSGEDRRVKKAFQSGERSGVYTRVAPDVVRPSFEERRSNPRSSSAKLRWAVRGGGRCA